MKRATKGDAQALLDAFGNGGWAVILHSRVAGGAPADTQIQIRPFDFFNGRHYCALDWHTILIADIEGGDKSFTHEQAATTIANLSVEFTLDGSPVTVAQTPVERFLDPQRFDLEVAYYSQWGHVLAPSDLAVGEHTLSVQMSDASAGPVFANTINFFIDPEGSGACL